MSNTLDTRPRQLREMPSFEREFAVPTVIKTLIRGEDLDAALARHQAWLDAGGKRPRP